jgi:hypothetical protein
VLELLPAGESYRVVLEGRAPAGAAQLRISRMEMGTIHETMVFESVPVTVSTAATLTLATPALPVGASLAFQYESGAPVDAVGSLPVLSGPASRDLLPPRSSIAIADGIVTITAEDEPGGAGVLRILYSTEATGEFTQYTGPLALPPSAAVIRAVAIDRAGNAEYPGAQIKIEQTSRIFLPLLQR